MTASRPPGQRPVSSSRGSRDIRPLTEAQLRKIQDFISSNLSEKLTLSQIAQEVHLSADHLARRFKVSTGQSLRQYIISHRLQRARHFLLTSEISIAEIALLVGFTDHSHLTHSFKERFGVTPQAARRARRTSRNLARESTRQSVESAVL